MQYYNKIKQQIQQEEIEYEQIGQFIRIIDPPIRQWEKEEWMIYIQNVPLKNMAINDILQQMRKPFAKELRCIIYPYLASEIEIPILEYTDNKSFASGQDHIIFRDIERTHTSLEYYKGKRQSKRLGNDSNKSVIDEHHLENVFSYNQKRLFYILRAYANMDSTIGYVQGMNYIAGSILYSIDDGSNILEIEAKTLQILLYINQKLNWRQTYSKSMKKLKQMVQHFQNLLKQYLPKVYEVIVEMDMPFLIFIDQQFFTLMNYKLPFEFSIKILDIFLIQGESIIFDVLLRVYMLNEEQIVELRGKEDLIDFLKDIITISLETYGINALIPQDEILL